MASGMCEIMEKACRGMLDYTFLGGAQIDMYGNLNSTRIGPDHQKTNVRFPGSGGANDFASFCWRMMVMTPQDAKRFAEKCQFISGILPGSFAMDFSRSAISFSVTPGLNFMKTTCLITLLLLSALPDEGNFFISPS